MIELKKKMMIEKINFRKQDFNLFIFFSIVGLITFSSLIIYELPNPDAIWNDLYYKDSWGWECRLGRYMIRFFQAIFGNVINSSAFTILCVLLLALICVIVINIFEMKGIIAMLGGIMLIVSPTIVSTLTYYYCSLYYMIAYTLAVITAWIICKRKDWISAIIGIICLCISLATYQAYIGIVLVLAVMFLIFSLLDKEVELKSIMYRILYMVVVVAGGIISYLISCKLIQNMFEIVAESSRGFSEMGSIPLEKIGNLLKNCYIYTFQYFFSTEMLNNNYGNKRNLNILILFIFAIVLLREILKTEKKWYYKLLTIIAILIFPIALMSITIAASSVNIYDTTGVIMLPTMNYVYVFALVFLFRIEKQRNSLYCLKCGGFVVLAVMAISLFNVCLSAQTYQKYSMNRMDYLSKSIVYDIEECVDNSDEYSVCFIGQAENGNYPIGYPELLDSLHWITASHGTVWKDFLGTQECWKAYIKQNVGKRYKRCGSEEYDEIVKSDFFKNMNDYPDDNSIAVYDNSIVVIRLSDVEK